MNNLQKSVKIFYNTTGEYFSKTRVWPWPEVTPYLKRLKNHDRILDLGCGNGRLLAGINTDVNYLGIDFSKTLIQEAKKLHPNHKFILVDITKQETWKGLGKFDAIFCIATLHHIPKCKQQLFILKKARQHLKRNGFLCASVWNLWQPKHLKHHLSLQSLRLKIKNLNWRFLYFPFQQKYQRFCVAFDRIYLNNLLRDAGFKKIKLFYSGKNGEKTNLIRGKNLCSVAS